MIQFKDCIISVVFLFGSMLIGIHSTPVFPEDAPAGLNQELEGVRSSLVRYKVATTILGTFLGTGLLFSAISASKDKPIVEKLSTQSTEDVDLMNKRVTTLERLVKGGAS